MHILYTVPHVVYVTKLSTFIITSFSVVELESKQIYLRVFIHVFLPFSTVIYRKNNGNNQLKMSV